MYGRPAKAASFSMRTGYYIGTGVGSTQISGLGFQPDLVYIKASSNDGVGVYKTSAMPSANLAFTSNTADDTSSQLTLDSDGFTVGTLTNVNAANVHYMWTAFVGSDCSSSGNFCVGIYTGNGSSPRTISTGFQPGIVWVKRDTSAAGTHFHTASMPVNRTDFFNVTAGNTTGIYIRDFSSSGFSVGANDNASGGSYYFVAFKSGAPSVAEGTYTGNGADDRDISGVGIDPDFVFVKNATSGTTNNRRAVMSTDQHFGDMSSYVGDAFVSNTNNAIQALQTDGFQVGSAVQANESGTTMYWFAFAGTPGPPSGSGDFTMAVGSYTGNGSSQSISGIGFRPDLVIVKDESANQAVFTSTMIGGSQTAYMSSSVSDFSGGISSLDSDGFSVGSNAQVNTNGNTYHWQAFGNAFNPYTNSGSSNFAVGAYYGNSIDDREINNLPFQPDMVMIKRTGTFAGTYKLSSSVGDLSSSFAGGDDSANRIQALGPGNGFQVGTDNQTNSSGGIYRWFAFKEGANFYTSTYTGGVPEDTEISDVGFTPDLVWVRRTQSVAPIHRSSSISGDNSQYFTDSANVAGRVKSFTASGFTIGTGIEVNQSTGVYNYAAWRIPSATGSLGADIVDSGGTSITSPTFPMATVGFSFECGQSSGSLGASSQRVRVTNTSASPAWSLSIAATDGVTALWRNGGNTEQYDFNDGTGSPNGCSDGVDGDTRAGQMTIDPSVATVSPQSGCSTTGLSLGTSSSFAEGSNDAVTLISASSGADTGCYWDITGIGLNQFIPDNQPPDNYSINLTITAVTF